jgi:hypothetical protein
MQIEIIAPENPTLQVATPLISTTQLTIARGERGPAGIDGNQAVLDHIADPEPHPSYDDLPSLTLLFENGLI